MQPPATPLAAAQQPSSTALLTLPANWLAAAAADGGGAAATDDFVARNGTLLLLRGDTYRFLGELPRHALLLASKLESRQPAAALPWPRVSRPAAPRCLLPLDACAGFNHPQLVRYAASGDPERQRYLTDLLDRAEALGLRVFRTFAHFEGARAGWRPRAGTGVAGWHMHAALKRLLAPPLHLPLPAGYDVRRPGGGGEFGWLSLQEEPGLYNETTFQVCWG